MFWNKKISLFIFALKNNSEAKFLIALKKSTNSIFMINKTFFILFLFTGTLIYSQNIKTQAQPTILGDIAYFIKNKLVSKEELVVIKPEEIESVNVVKRDTVIEKRRYSGQIFVVLKTPIKSE